MSNCGDSQLESPDSKWKDAPTPRINPWASPAKTKDLKEAFFRQAFPPNQRTTAAQVFETLPEPPQATARAASSTSAAGAVTQSKESLDLASHSLDKGVDAEDRREVAEFVTLSASGDDSSSVNQIEAKSSRAEEETAEAEHNTHPGSPTADHSAKTTTLQVPASMATNSTGTPQTAMTTMTDIIDAAAEQEKTGQRFAETMCDRVEVQNAAPRCDSVKRKRKEEEHRLRQTSDQSEESESSFSQSIRHPSAMPPALHVRTRGQAESRVRQHMKRMFSKSRPKVEEKPLPPIPDSGNPYDPDSTSYISGAYIPSPVTLQDDKSSYVPIALCEPVNYQQQDQELNPGAAAIGSGAGRLFPNRVVDVTSDSPATGRFLTDTTEKFAHRNLSSLVTYDNQNEGIILSHGPFITPTRCQGFATRQQAQIAHPPSQHSFVASIVDPHSPSYRPFRDRASVIPEPKGTRAEQYTAAQPVEKIYDRDSQDSASSPDPTGPAEFDAVELERRPRLTRSSSVPAVAVHPFNLRNPCIHAATATGNGLSAAFSPSRAAGTAVSGDAGATPATSAPIVTVSAVVGLVHSRLDHLHAQVNDMEARLVAVQQAANAEILRRMDGLEAQLNRAFALVPRQRGGGSAPGVRGGRGGRGGMMQARLGAMPPHIPYGGQQNGW